MYVHKVANEPVRSRVGSQMDEPAVHVYLYVDVIIYILVPKGPSTQNKGYLPKTIVSISSTETVHTTGLGVEYP